MTVVVHVYRSGDLRKGCAFEIIGIVSVANRIRIGIVTFRSRWLPVIILACIQIPVPYIRLAAIFVQETVFGLISTHEIGICMIHLY